MQGHYLLGLRILHMLVAEFNQPTSGRTMTLHRKLAVAFRDASLLKVFQIAIAAMQQLQGNTSADEKLREQVLFSQHEKLHQIKALVLFPVPSLPAPRALSLKIVVFPVYLHHDEPSLTLLCHAVCRQLRLLCSASLLTLSGRAWMSRQKTWARYRCGILLLAVPHMQARDTKAWASRPSKVLSWMCRCHQPGVPLLKIQQHCSCS